MPISAVGRAGAGLEAGNLMAGRRRDFDGQFAMAEIGFWLNDPRIVGTSAAFKTYLHYAWMIAVKERRETLQNWYDPVSIGRAAGLDPRTSRKCASLAIQKCLHSQTPDGRVIVCGVMAKHPNLRWRDESINGFMRTHNATQSESESESELESESEKGPPLKKRRTPNPKPDEDSQTTKPTRTRKPTECEKAFADQFYDQYSQTCQIERGHAIKLAQRVRNDGTETVKRKITAWWGFKLPDSFRGQRTIAAFLGWYDSIPATGGVPGSDLSRFDDIPRIVSG